MPELLLPTRPNLRSWSSRATRRRWLRRRRQQQRQRPRPRLRSRALTRQRARQRSVDCKGTCHVNFASGSRKSLVIFASMFHGIKQVLGDFLDPASSAAGMKRDTSDCRWLRLFRRRLQRGYWPRQRKVIRLRVVFAARKFSWRRA